jgi:hypothetical protein
MPDVVRRKREIGLESFLRRKLPRGALQVVMKRGTYGPYFEGLGICTGEGWFGRKKYRIVATTHWSHWEKDGKRAPYKTKSTHKRWVIRVHDPSWHADLEDLASEFETISGDRVTLLYLESPWPKGAQPIEDDAELEWG